MNTTGADRFTNLGGTLPLTFEPSVLYVQPAILYFGTSFSSLVAQRLKCLPAMLETWVRSLGREDPLEKEMATHSSILAWRLQSTGSQRVRHDSDFTSVQFSSVQLLSCV